MQNLQTHSQNFAEVHLQEIEKIFGYPFLRSTNDIYADKFIQTLCEKYDLPLVII